MTDQNKDIGEGSYEGARAYREKTAEFLAKKGKSVPDLAHEAEAALDGPQGDALRDAEAEGRRHAKS
jgi:hypothetical protein